MLCLLIIGTVQKFPLIGMISFNTVKIPINHYIPIFQNEIKVRKLKKLIQGYAFVNSTHIHSISLFLLAG